MNKDHLVAMEISSIFSKENKFETVGDLQKAFEERLGEPDMSKERFLEWSN